MPHTAGQPGSAALVTRGPEMSYIVMSSSCNSPAAKRWRGYRNLALVELRPGFATPKMISERARGVRRIVEYHHSVFVGECRGYGRDLLETLNRKAEALSAGRLAA